MAQINLGRKEVSCKIVYYGPGLSGKTTNLEKVYEKTPDNNKGRLTSIATEGDRTLFFDYMPLDIGKIGSMNTKFQLYTVPGQTYYRSTRKLVLQGADGVIFVADSGRGKLEENLQSLTDLHENLAENGLKLEEMPFVIQYNKRDMPDVLDIAVLQEKLNELNAPHFEACAVQGDGVISTLKGLSRMVLEKLNSPSLGRVAPAPPKPTPAAEPTPPEPVTAEPPKLATAPKPNRPARPAPTVRQTQPARPATTVRQIQPAHASTTRSKPAGKTTAHKPESSSGSRAWVFVVIALAAAAAFAAFVLL